VAVPAGRWRIRTSSDDGIRVHVDGEAVIDDWTWHPPRTHEAELTVETPRVVDVLVEHFELDGYAVLTVEFEPVD
jgi:mannan endo-1,4-beta-mannosidase